MMQFCTPLRYPGGKRKLASFIKLVFGHNNLVDSHYVEPYAGGAGVALALLFDEYVSYIHINDLSRPIYAFWHSVLFQSEALCTRILETPVTMDEWYRQRTIQENANEVSLIDLGFSTFFMNRTNRSGIINGGVIGGKNQSGPYKLDARYNKEDLILRIKRIARYRNRISLYNKDAGDFIITDLPTLPPNSFVYLDPPYYVKGQELYENFYEHEDHKNVSNLVGQIKQKWIVTYDNTPEVLHLYQSYRHIVYDLSYSAADHYRGSEIMFFCDELTLPQVKNPTKISSRAVNCL